MAAVGVAVAAAAGQAGQDRLAAGAARLDDRGRQKRGATIGKSPVNRGRPSTKLHAVCDGRGVPLALLLGPGNRHDRVHALAVVDALPRLRARRRGRENRPSRLFADRGYDADWLREALLERGITPHIPYKQKPGRGRVRDPQAGQRWPIERTNAWLHNYRRLTTRWERRPELYLAFAQLAAALIICRRLNDAF